MKNKVFTTMLLGAAVPMVTGEAAEFIPLGEATGTLSSSVIDLSADGTTVLGIGYTGTSYQLFRWSADLGYSVLPSFDPGTFFPNFFAASISGDGSTVAGYATTDGSSYTGLKWSAADGFTYLGFLPTPGSTAGVAFSAGISDDGNAVALYGTAPNTPIYSALMWTSSLGLVPLGFLPGDEPDDEHLSYSLSWGISGNGEVVVGSSFSTRNTTHQDQAFRWTAGEGMQPLGFLPGETSSSALTVSADGSVVVGMSGIYAFRWSAESGMENIGSFTPSGVSANGNVIVGTSIGQDAAAVIWTPATSVQPLKDYLENTFNLSVPWQALTDAVSISNDGQVIAGTGINADGNEEAFLATIGSAAPERAGAVSFSGPVSFYLVDPAGSRYGIDPVTGASFSEIADLTLSQEGALKTAAWPDFVDGEHRIHLTGTGTGTYQLGFDFLHLDSEASGAAFSGELLAGGLHIYAATVSADTAAGANYRLVFADTDGDKVEDAADAVPRSDMRPTVVISGVDSGVSNKVMASGTTLNDALACLVAKSPNRGQFVSGMNNLVKTWVNAGIISKNEANAILAAAKVESTTSLTQVSRASLDSYMATTASKPSPSGKQKTVPSKR